MDETMEEIFIDELVIGDEPLEIEEATPVTAEPEPTLVPGVVDNCARLNIREQPDRNADVVAVLPVGTELMIDLTTDLSDWYDVCTASGISGFCMKEFVRITQ